MSAKKYGAGACLVVGLLLAGVIALKRDLLAYNQFRSTRITDRNGRLLRTLLSNRGTTSIWAPLDRISPHFIQAQIAAEDKRFFIHPGIDPLAVGRAMNQNWKKRRVVSGASTLTQQLVRVVRGYPRSWPFKIGETVQALLLETVASKKEILEHYLNRVPYGNQCYGIGAAAKLYFDKPPSQLSLAESAFIAGLAQSPSRYNPYRNPLSAKTRQRYVLDRLVADGKINQEERRQALQEPLALVPNKGIFRAPHFCDMVIEALPLDPDRIPPDIRTTLDLELQQDLEGMVAGHVKQLSTEHLSNAAVIVMDNRSGDILAMVGSADYFSEENAGQVNGALAPRPPGSTWKPFTYALALENGRSAADVIPDVPLHAATGGGDFSPANYDERYHGPTRLRTALACSYNIPAVRLLSELGTGALLQRLQDLGFSFLTQPANHYGLGLTLGGAEANLLQLVRAYTALANDGVWKPEKFLMSDESPPEEHRRIFSPFVAFLVTDILADRDARRPAFGGYSSLSLPFPCAIKTGTSKNYRDGWTIGYTPERTVGAWVGNFDGRPMKSISGASGASMLFKQAMIRASLDAQPGHFFMPRNLQQAAVCPLSGLRPSPDCPSVIREKFIIGTEPGALCAVHRRIGIDTRTGLLASSDCDPAFVRHELFEVYDPIYQKWADENQIPSPPASLSPLCSNDAREEPAVPAESDPDLQVSKLEIIFPDNGDVFMIDPVLRREYQTIRLSARWPQEAGEVQWLVNGAPFKPRVTHGEIRWPLEPGRHVFKLRAKIKDAWTESEQVTINVI